MVDFSKLNELELDALKELGNIGVGKAATSLSQMLGKTIELSVPEVRIVEISKLYTVFDSEKIVAGVVTGLTDLERGEVGYLYIMFLEDSSNKLISILLGDDAESEVVDSTIMEVGNILSSSFCDATAELLGIMLMPTPPSFAVDYPIAIIDSIVSKLAEKSDSILVFKTELKEEEDSIDIYILLIPSEQFMSYILKLMNMVE